MPAQIHYFTLKDETPRKDKLDWFRDNALSSIELQRIHPDEKGNWLNITDNDFETLLPLASKEVKGNKAGPEFDKAVFKLFSTGVSTNRDEWVIDFSPKELSNRMKFFTDFYNSLNKSNQDFDGRIKWSRNLKQQLSRGNKEEFDANRIQKINYRPFIPTHFYNSEIFVDEHGQSKSIFKKENAVFSISGNGSSKPFQVLGINGIFSLDFLEKTQCLPLYRYDESGNRIENITDWGLEQFRGHYQKTYKVSENLIGLYGLNDLDNKITKEDIFHYVYAVLHNPAYRKKYEQNLKREFPRIPFYDDFEKWAAWGKDLMELHINYENTKLFPLKRVERVISQAVSSDQRQLFARVEEVEPLYRPEVKIKPKLKADKEVGTIEIDEQTTLTGIPAEAWAYKLGNRSALEWILDQYKESKPTDFTILEKFNHYRFADYKEEVIMLLQKVCTVSVETMKIIRAMEAE